MVGRSSKLRPKLLSEIHILDGAWKRALPRLPQDAKKWAKAAFDSKTHGIASAEMGLVFAGDKMLRQLNREFRGKDKATNVLSFAEYDGKQLKKARGGKGVYLGDVVISLDTVKREAKAQKKKLRDHAAHMVVHGVLHLLGFDHMEEKEAQKMERAERKILAAFKINDPYLIDGESHAR